MKSNYHVATAAEAIAAGQFARLEFDVSIQYGANQPEYDLMIADGEQILKVSVKGSNTGRWGLTQSYLGKIKEETGKTNYHAAADAWSKQHKPRTIICFVQFYEASLDEMPRIFLAWPHEVASLLKAVAHGKGGTILYENHTWTKRAIGAGAIERIPDEWKLSKERIKKLFSELEDCDTRK